MTPTYVSYRLPIQTSFFYGFYFFGYFGNLRQGMCVS